MQRWAQDLQFKVLGVNTDDGRADDRDPKKKRKIVTGEPRWVMQCGSGRV